ncbi:L-histidine N(alpha)-methyltransferase [Phenylobacterium koreense]|uniref:Dimethylhistidine N-methyltransferase n=2 Tax=Phenylobacterium TaxID=20 RepID=A0ABV2EEW8_9CAUL
MLDTETRVPFQAAFRSDVLRGLSGPRKSLPARWLYDDHGSALFEVIASLEEYYPTRTETAILTASAQEIAQFVGPGAVLLEYGAGAALKTEILLSALAPTAYVPVDIAGDFLAASAVRLAGRFPGLDVRPCVADFTVDFELPDDLPPGRTVGFFPGSTIGNLAPDEAKDFLRRMASHVGQGGAGLIGVDLKKDLEPLLAAYDDREGVTARFNLNLLVRINRELGGNFDIGAFKHQARWNPMDSAVEMHAVSTRAQTVVAAGQTFAFEAGESIHTESSRKYDLQQFADLATASGWRVGPVWTDSEDRFAVVALIVPG